MAGPQAQRPISQHEGTSASRALRPIVQDVEQQHVEIAVDEEDDDQRTKEDVERGEAKRVRHRHHHRRPLYRRLISYIRNAWTAGVNFSSSNGIFEIFVITNCRMLSFRFVLVLIYLMHDKVFPQNVYTTQLTHITFFDVISH